MITKSKLALALVIAMGIASPAFAQSFNPEIGTGNTVLFSYQQTDPIAQVAVRTSGLYAYVPAGNTRGSAVSGYDPGIETQR